MIGLDLVQSFKEKFQMQRALKDFEEDMLHFPSFLLLTFLACLVACFGILRENDPVIIGAMIMTPLVSPFVGIPLAIVMKQKILLLKSVLYVITGCLLFFGTAYLCGKLFFDGRIQEIWLLKTNIIEVSDYAIALVAGVVAALAISSERIHSVISGAAIALALAPPLAISAINLSIGNINFFKTGLHLFGINALGLIVMGFFVFLVFGFRKKEEPTQ